MGTRLVGVGAVDGRESLTIGVWGRCRDGGTGPGAIWRASWTAFAGAEGVWIGRSGRGRAVTVGATFGVLVGDR